MSLCVLLSGLPGRAKLSTVVYVIKKLLSNHDIAKFWITDQADIRGTDLKTATISFDSAADAQMAVNILDGFLFHFGKDIYPLKTEIEIRSHRSPSPNRRRSNEFEDRYYERRSSRERLRSRSPLYEESSRLDLEIELLKKKQLIIEEERRLLLESKKLEMIKEFGHDAVRDIHSFTEDRHSRRREFDRRRHEFDRERDDFDRRRDDFGRRREDFGRRRDDFSRRRDDSGRRRDDSGRRRDDSGRRRDDSSRRNKVDRRREDFDRREYRNRRSPQRRTLSTRRPTSRDIPVKLFPSQKQRLPKFKSPVANILAEMGETLEKYELNEVDKTWLKVEIRLRLAKLLENTTKIMSSVQVCELYRETYPPSEDDDYIEKFVAECRNKKSQVGSGKDSSNQFNTVGDKQQIVKTDCENSDDKNEAIIDDKANNEITEHSESVNLEEVEEIETNAMESIEDHDEQTQETNNKVEPGLEDSNMNGDEIKEENVKAEACEKLHVVVKEDAKVEEVNNDLEVPAEETTEVNDNSDWVEGTEDWN